MSDMGIFRQSKIQPDTTRLSHLMTNTMAMLPAAREIDRLTRNVASTGPHQLCSKTAELWIVNVAIRGLHKSALFLRHNQPQWVIRGFFANEPNIPPLCGRVTGNSEITLDNRRCHTLCVLSFAFLQVQGMIWGFITNWLSENWINACYSSVVVRNSANSPPFNRCTSDSFDAVLVVDRNSAPA